MEYYAMLSNLAVNSLIQRLLYKYKLSSSRSYSRSGTGPRIVLVNVQVKVPVHNKLNIEVLES